MRLTEYLVETGTKPSGFAERVGVAPSTVSRILNRERSMSLDMAVKMARATDGQVTIDDIIAEFSNDDPAPPLADVQAGAAAPPPVAAPAALPEAAE